MLSIACTIYWTIDPEDYVPKIARDLDFLLSWTTLVKLTLLLLKEERLHLTTYKPVILWQLHAEVQ